MSFAKSRGLRVTSLFISLALLLACASCAGQQDATSDTSGNESGFVEMDIEEMPDSLSSFLEFFGDWYVRSGAQKNYYDCTKAGEGDTNILGSIVNNPPCVSWNSYPVKEYEEFWESKTSDPKNWSKETHGVTVTHVDDAQLAEIKAKLAPMMDAYVKRVAQNGIDGQKLIDFLQKDEGNNK